MALFGNARADQIIPQSRRASPSPTYTSPLQFYIASKMTAAEFAQVETSIRGARIQGLVNVNTASSRRARAAFLGLDSGKASQLVTYRQSNPTSLNSIAWVSTVLDETSAITAGPWLTGKSYQFMADVAAVGHQGRGYRRTRFVFDTSSGTTDNPPSPGSRPPRLGARQTSPRPMADGETDTMISFLKNLKKQGASSVLGLALDGNRLEAVVLRRLNGALQVQQSLTATLALSPLTRRSGIGRARNSEPSGPGRHSRTPLRRLHSLELGFDLAYQTARSAGR